MTPAEIRARAEELVGRATTAYVADGDRLTGIHVAPSIIDAIAAALLSARAEALREAAEVAEDSDYPVDRLYTSGRKAAAAAIRALATNQEPADE